MDIEDIIGEAQPPQASVTICVRGDLVATWERLHAEFRTAPEQGTSLGEGSPRARLQARLRELGEEMKTAQRTFVFQSLPATEYSALMAQHPPKGNEVGVYSFNRETFRPALVAASCIDPVMDDKQVERLFAKLSRGQIVALGDAAFEANQGGLDIPFDGAVYAENQDSDGS